MEEYIVVVTYPDGSKEVCEDNDGESVTSLSTAKALKAYFDAAENDCTYKIMRLSEERD